MIGATIRPTRRHEMNAAVAALTPSIVMSAQRAAWPSMPTAIGRGSRRQGIEKNVPKLATAQPAAMTSAAKGAVAEGAA